MEKLTSILTVARNADDGAGLLNKVVKLARPFGARIEMMVCDPTAICAIAVHGTRLGFPGISYSLHTSDEPIADAIQRRVRELSSDLVVKAPASRPAWAAFGRNPSDFALAEKLPVPLLLAGERPWGSQLRFAAAVDIADRHTESFARTILHAGGFLALGCQATLDVLYSERESSDSTMEMERAVTLARLVREFHLGTERMRILAGPPEESLPPELDARKFDLLALGGVSRRSGLLNSLRPLAGALVAATRGDVLLVKPEDVTLRAPPLSREQFAHQAEQFT